MTFLPACGRHDPVDLAVRLAGHRVVASVSGGKDSAALSLYLTDLGIEHDRVFMDTGWENEVTYSYLRGPLAAKIGPIAEIRSARYPGGMPDLVTGRGMFPSRVRRMCTQELKVFPMQAHLRGLEDQGIDPINVVGIRAEESPSRALMGEWEFSDTFDCDVWRPLIRWTEADVIAIHRHFDLPPNPLYLAGASRVGCWPCIFARKAEIRMVAELTPEKIIQIGRLEERVTEIAAAKNAADGFQNFESRGHTAPAFFQAQGSLRNPLLGKDGRCTPIAEVVAWSRTPTRGVEPEPFDDPNKGCMRWGLCETHPMKERPMNDLDLSDVAGNALGAVEVNGAPTKPKRGRPRKAPGEVSGTRRADDAYDTHPALALACVEWIRRAGLVPEAPVAGSTRILEPTAGGGPFVAAARQSWPDADIAAVDIREECRAACFAAGAAKFACADALALPVGVISRADLILTNPPFKLADRLARHFFASMKDGASLAFLLSVTFIGSSDRWELENGGPSSRPGLFKIAPLRYLVPIVPRPAFTGTSPKFEACLMIWSKGWEGETTIPREPVRWVKGK
jgi:3'-phosphoadenosine 5'-phosphosulfate sulfotransferase (PAPS reductase)/FAD synthetase